MRERRQRQRRRRRYRSASEMVALLVVPPVLYVILAAVFGWWPAGPVNDAFYLRNHGVAATGVVIESEERECPEPDTGPDYTPPVAPTPPLPPMPPLRNLDGAAASFTAPTENDGTRAQGGGGCGWSVVAVEYASTTYTREFEEFWGVGTEFEVLLDPEDPGRFVSREDTQTWALVGATGVLVLYVGIGAFVLYCVVGTFLR